MACAAIEYHGKSVGVGFVGDDVGRAVVHKGEPRGGVADTVDLLVGVVVFQRFGKTDLTADCVAVGVFVTVDDDCFVLLQQL